MVGSATALYLLLKIPLWAGVIITVVDVLFILAFGTHNFRILELIVFLLIATVCGCAQPGTRTSPHAAGRHEHSPWAA